MENIQIKLNFGSRWRPVLRWGLEEGKGDFRSTCTLAGALT